MRNASPFVDRQLVGANVEAAIDGGRIAVDDLPVERFSERQAEGALAGCSGTEDCENPWRHDWVQIFRNT
jgi:hypothetical protein